MGHEAQQLYADHGSSAGALLSPYVMSTRRVVTTANSARATMPPIVSCLHFVMASVPRCVRGGAGPPRASMPAVWRVFNAGATTRVAAVLP